MWRHNLAIASLCRTAHFSIAVEKGGGGHDHTRPADVLIAGWDRGKHVCGDELLDDMGEEDVHTTSEVCAGEEGEQNGSEDEFHHQNYFDDMGEENVQTTSEASAGLREQSNSVHLENTLPQSTNVTHDGAQASKGIN